MKDKLVLLLIVLIAIGAIMFVNNGKGNERENRNLLEKSGEYTIGKIDGKTYSNGSSTYCVSFSYKLNGKEHSNGDHYCYLDSDLASDAFNDKRKAKRNDRFIVLYEKGNPENSIIRLDFPIATNYDYENFERKLKQLRGVNTDK